MSWDRVHDWIDRLSALDASTFGTSLSPAGARAAWEEGLASLHPAALQSAAARAGTPWRTATCVTAGTVITAPLEWCAVLLGRGTEVILKVPSQGWEWSGVLEHTAQRAGLPLTVRSDRDAIARRQFVMAMGSDQTMAKIEGELSEGTVFDPHGHRFSVAWVTGQPTSDPRVPKDFRDPWGAVAADLALHDGRGCLSPVAVFTPLPLHAAGPALADALARAEPRWPAGQIAGSEWALARSRGALAQVVGEVYSGGAGAVHAVPERWFEPATLPRHVLLCSVASPIEMARVLEPWSAWLSTIATDDPGAVAAWESLGPVRTCGLGRIQRHDLVRIHDGRDWVAATLRPH